MFQSKWQNWCVYQSREKSISYVIYGTTIQMTNSSNNPELNDMPKTFIGSVQANARSVYVRQVAFYYILLSFTLMYMIQLWNEHSLTSMTKGIEMRFHYTVYAQCNETSLKANNNNNNNQNADQSSERDRDKKNTHNTPNWVARVRIKVNQLCVWMRVFH